MHIHSQATTLRAKDLAFKVKDKACKVKDEARMKMLKYSSTLCLFFVNKNTFCRKANDFNPHHL